MKRLGIGTLSVKEGFILAGILYKECEYRCYIINTAALEDCIKFGEMPVSDNLIAYAYSKRQ